ncbi:hypothetical protein RB195_015215 [Necator americanus]|uniref:G-protein coupled receptors family 1 profile domain-containing protein n=1 Tax=Necator americanus TaxID=51031 RepID=A0ABR1E3I1_NECAM
MASATISQSAYYPSSNPFTRLSIIVIEVLDEVQQQAVKRIQRDKTTFTLSAISYILVGRGRADEIERGVLFTRTTVHGCFVTKYWPHALILGTELPSYCLLVVSCERLLVVLRPLDYSRYFGEISKCQLLLFVPLAGTISLMAACFSAHLDGDRTVETQHCFIIDSTAAWFASFHFLIVVAAFVVSFISFLVTWRILVRRVHGRHIMKTSYIGTWLTISAISALLVSLPSAVMLGKLWIGADMSDVTVAIAYAIPGFLSILNTMVNFTLHKEFRGQLLALFGFKRSNLDMLRLDKPPIGKQFYYKITPWGVQLRVNLMHVTCWSMCTSDINYTILARYRLVHCPCLISVPINDVLT